MQEEEESSGIHQRAHKIGLSFKDLTMTLEQPARRDVLHHLTGFVNLGCVTAGDNVPCENDYY